MKSYQNRNEMESLSEHVRLEIINLAVLFRARMIGKKEFERKARSLGVDISPERVFDSIPSLDIQGS